MSEYGLELYNSKGVKALSINDRLGRFLGKFYVPDVMQGESKKFIFDIPVEHRGLGELFLLYTPTLSNVRDSYDTFYVSNINLNVYIQGESKIVADISVEKVNTDWSVLKLRAFEIMYGVY